MIHDPATKGRYEVAIMCPLVAGERPTARDLVWSDDLSEAEAYALASDREPFGTRPWIYDRQTRKFVMIYGKPWVQV